MSIFVLLLHSANFAQEIENNVKDYGNFIEICEC